MRFAKSLNMLSVATLSGLAAVYAPNAAQAADVKAPIPTLGNTSAYNLGQGQEADYLNSQDTFRYITFDENNNLVNNYYKVELKELEPNIDKYDNYALAKTEFGTGTETEYYNWSDDDHYTFAETTSSNKNITVKYNPGTGNYIDKNQTTNAETLGGAITNDAGALGDITADFAGNYASGTSSSGGAIYNGSGNIGNIVGDFVTNYVYGSTAQGLGGAIYNGTGTFNDITGDFVGNYANGSSSQGGAIYNDEGTFGKLNSNFVGNHSVGHNAHADGGAIFNNAGTIGDITGSFIGNYVHGSSSQGGAIYNESEIGKITGDFIGNYVYGSVAHGEGGAIYNVSGKIGDIEGDFVGNYVEGTSAQGGAISNIAEIGDIKGNFIGNYLIARTAHGEGGAIFNYASGKIGNIEGDFIRNYVKSNGGAILNMGEMGYIKGDFVDNYVDGWGANGGAIINRGGSIGDITGDFVRNYVNGDQSKGGAISNLAGSLGHITGDFVDNTAFGWDAKGGAIYNAAGIIGNITGSFVRNETNVAGGAIANGGIIGDVTGDFLYNTSNTTGGAIGNEGSLGNITGDFIGNESATGGAIGNDGVIKDISGNFILNEGSDGGAIANAGEIGDIEGDFVDNHASNQAGAIGNANIIGNITGDFIGNSAGSDGGAIANTGTIENIEGGFVGNSAQTGGALVNIGEITSVKGNFQSNEAMMGAAVVNTNKIGSITGNFVENTGYISSSVYNMGNIGSIAGDFINNTSYAVNLYNIGKINSISGDFIGNTSSNFGSGAIANDNYLGALNSNFDSNTGSIMGGALQNSGTIGNITGDFSNNLVKGNFDEFMAPLILKMTKEELDNFDADAWYQTQLQNVDPSNYQAMYELNSTYTSFKISKSMRPSFGGAVFNSTMNLALFGLLGSESLNGLPSNVVQDLEIDVNNIKMGDIKGNFSNNVAEGNVSYGGAIANVDWANKLNLLYQASKIGIEYFNQNNEGKSEEQIIRELAVAKQHITIGDIQGDFTNNKAASGGAIANFAMDKNVIGSLASVIDMVKVPADDNPEMIQMLSYLPDMVAKELGITPSEVRPATLEIGNISGNFVGNQASATDFGEFQDAIDTIYTAADSYKQMLMESNDESITWDEVIGYINQEIFQEKIKSTPDQDKLRNLELDKYIAKNVENIDKLEASLKDSLGKGGAIFNKGGKIGNITNSTFVENSASTDFAGIDAQGGAIYSEILPPAPSSGVVAEYAQVEILNDDGTIYKQFYMVKNPYWDENNSSGGNSILTGEEVETLIRDGNISELKLVQTQTVTKAEIEADVPPEEIENMYAEMEEMGFLTNPNDILAEVQVPEEIPSLNIIDSSFVGNYVRAVNADAMGGAIYAKGTTTEPKEGGQVVAYITMRFENPDGSVYKEVYLPYDISSDGQPVNMTAEELETLIENGTVTDVEPLGSSVAVIPITTLEEQMASQGKTVDDFFADLEAHDVPFTNPKEMLEKAQEPTETIVQNLVLKNSDLVGNYAESVNGMAKGGAIYAEDTIVDIVADNGKTMLISGNYTKNGEEIDNNAIYMNGSKLTFDVKNSSTIQIDDNINGENGYATYVTGDNTGMMIFNNHIKNTSINLENATVNVTEGSYLGNNNTLSLNSGVLNINHLGLESAHLNDLSLVNGELNIGVVDVDLAKETMGRITSDSYTTVSPDVGINIGAFNLTSDSSKERTEILFADKEIKDNVQTGVSTLPIESVQTAYTPIYKYNVAYDNREDGGFFVFNNTSTGGKTTFNPAVLAGPISAHAGAVSVSTQTINYGFQHSNEFMHIPYSERLTMKNRNKYALANTTPTMGKFSPLYQPSDDGSSVWVKSYATFENVPFKNGPKVSNITYGTLAGFDTEVQTIKNGWDRVFTGFVGYNGASQRYSGVDSIQNGGLLGGTVTLYKGNFFNATTVNVGASVASNQTMYGSENFAMLLSGIGNKTGYNFEFKEGRVILQPNMLTSYTFVNTFDYTNAAGVRIDSKPLHVLQLAPGLKLIGNTKNGWQPYASVSMIWNLMGESDATANGVRLPEMSIKPYVQYGVGVQKRIKDHFMGYGQAMIHNGGRNGISLTAGFRWALGHDNCKYEKTQRHNEVKAEGSITSKEILRSAQNDKGKCIRHSELDSESINANKTLTQGEGATGKKILKQMTPEQKMTYGGKRENTSITANYGSLKRL